MQNGFGLENPVKTVGYAELAQEVGRGEERTRQLAHKHLPDRLFVEVGKHRKVLRSEMSEAVQILRGVVGVTEPDTKSYNYGEEHARREHYEAEYSRLKLEEKRGALLDTKEVQRAYTDAVATTTKRIQQVPDQLSAELVGLGADEIRRLLKTALREALKQLQVEVRGVSLVKNE